MITEDFADFSVTGRVLLQVKLIKDSFIRVRLAHAGKELTHLSSFGSNVKLLRDLIQKFSMLVHYLNDVVQVIREFCHVDAELDESIRILSALTN